jgi:hypothetical protein
MRLNWAITHCLVLPIPISLAWEGANRKESSCKIKSMTEELRMQFLENGLTLPGDLQSHYTTLTST